ncbi:MAG: TIGR01777 family protein [Candidatus Aminicenantes bacterium]|nr:TIGR01777 family protein [Candidatus Aminicenantes bacterium]
MKILITGGTGFVGTQISSRLTQVGHKCTVLTRSPEKSKEGAAEISFLQGDPTKKGPWQDQVQKHEAVINLAGASIFRKWTPEHKNAIMESRVKTTRSIVDAIPSGPQNPLTLFSASAVGYYGFCGDEILTEASHPGDDFLARVTQQWEKEAFKAEDKGARVVVTRFGIVLGDKGGALGQMIPLFKKFIGGPIGSGKQWFSWVHMKDLCEAFVFLTRHPEIRGPVNVCSPHPVRNKELAKNLGKVLKKPSFLPAPGFLVKAVLGEFGSVVLKGQRVMPGQLMDKDFQFQYECIDEALRDILT